MKIIVNILVGTVAVLVATKLIPGVTLDTPLTALVVAVVLGIANAVLRPLLVLLTMPVTIISFGLFLFVINAIVVLAADALIPGFFVAGLWTAMLFSVVTAVVGWFLNALGE